MLLISGQLGEGPIKSALIRLLEVALAGAIAIIVSLIVIPVRADRLLREAAARALDEMAKDAPRILASLYERIDKAEMQAMQDSIGRSISALQDVLQQVEHERLVTFASAPDPAPLPRTLLRLRHDLVMKGRASAEPLPVHLGEHLRPRLEYIGDAVSSYLRACATALTSRRMPPPLHPLQTELRACASHPIASHQRELAHLAPAQLERLFALIFSLDQLRRNIVDLERCVRELAALPRRVADSN